MENSVQKMRDGIAEVRKALHRMCIGAIPHKTSTISAIIGRCDGLLEIKLRNCDVGDAEEQRKRLREFCKIYRVGIGKCQNCPVNGIFPKYCALLWAQMPYTESGVGE